MPASNNKRFVVLRLNFATARMSNDLNAFRKLSRFLRIVSQLRPD
jgi:hypothetical protein